MYIAKYFIVSSHYIHSIVNATFGQLDNIMRKQKEEACYEEGGLKTGVGEDSGDTEENDDSGGGGEHPGGDPGHPGGEGRDPGSRGGRGGRSWVAEDWSSC